MAGPPIAVGFSCGVTTCSAAQCIDAAGERADQAMYRAKTSGCNRSLSALEPPAMGVMEVQSEAA